MAASACFVKLDWVQTVSFALPVCADAAGAAARVPPATTSFSHDPTGRADRLDRFMGVENGQFFLHQGGFVNGFTQYGEKFTRPATGKPPLDFVLP